VGSLSLRLKILFSVTASCLAAVITTAIFMAQSGIQTTRDTIIKDSQTLAQVLGEASTGAITFEDTATVSASLAALKLSPRVISAAVYADNKAFAWYVQGRDAESAGTEIPSQPPAPGIVERDGLVEITEAIYSDSQLVGVITLHISMSELSAIVAEAIKYSLLVILVLGLLALLVSYLVQRSIVRPINHIVDALHNISEGEGDLTQRLPISGRDEVAELASCFNRFVERLQTIIAQVVKTADSLREDAERLSQLSSDNEKAILQQQNEIQQVAQAIREMAIVVDNVSQRVTETATESRQADLVAVAGKERVMATMMQIKNLSEELNAATGVIDRLQQETQSIGGVLDVIKGVAEQTNLLALNAAIEAARAGEQGRGFAVVADEVRTLASRTQSSTSEIREMIEGLQSGSHQAVTMMSEGNNQAGASVARANQASESLEEITAIVGVIRDRTNQIATAAEQQSASTRQMERNIHHISNVAVDAAQSSSHISTNTRLLADSASHLAELVGRFRV